MDADRRARLVELFDGPLFKGDRAKLIAKSGLTKGRIAQFFDPGQPFGERAARGLAQRLGLPENYFDSAGKSGLTEAPAAAPVEPVYDISPSEWGTLQDLRDMHEDDRAALLREARERSERFKAHRAQILKDYGITGEADPNKVNRIPFAPRRGSATKKVRVVEELTETATAEATAAPAQAETPKVQKTNPRPSSRYIAQGHHPSPAAKKSAKG
jgi:hypothetical protein